MPQPTPSQQSPALPATFGPTTLTDAMSDLVATCDANGFITYMNPALRAFIQRDTATHLPLERYPEVYGAYHPDGTLFAVDDLPLQMARAIGEPQRNVEILMRRPDGTEHLVIWDATPLRDATGTLLGAMAVGHDVTDDHALAQAREDWLATAAHDLRSPTTAILGNVQLARRTATQLARDLATIQPRSADGKHDHLAQARLTRLQRNLELVEARTHDLLRFMATLLDASASAEGTLTLFPTPGGVDLTAILVLAAEHISQVTKRHQVVTHLPPHAVLVDGDEVRLRQLVDNLLSNALKYSPDGGQITLTLQLSNVVPASDTLAAAQAASDNDNDTRHHSASLATAPRWAVVSVADEGMGIPPADIEHIFERYRRASGPASRVRGTGIGLYASRAIVEAHGGQIWVERTATPPSLPTSLHEGDLLTNRDHAAPWHGTVIAFALPLHVAQQPDAAGATSRRPEVASSEQ